MSIFKRLVLLQAQNSFKYVHGQGQSYPQEQRSRMLKDAMLHKFM